MKYDKRIINPVENIYTPFDTVPADDFVGTKGYFAVHIESFYDLDECGYGTLKGVKQTADDEYEDLPYQAIIEKGEREGEDFYSYFLPAEEVKIEEKRWRPFIALDEFLKRFPLLSPVTFKNKTNDEILVGCVTAYSKTKPRVRLGGTLFDFEELFTHYEYQDEDGNWSPFGVEE